MKSELLLRCFSDSGTSLLSYKVRKEVLPCLRSITSSLRVAEHILGEAPLIREFPREVTTINTLQDSITFLNNQDGQEK